MTLPQSLAAALAAADEAYLIGLSNKGTVNRAKKDLTALAAPQLQVEGQEAEVRMGDVVCRIRAPLGDSSCSCPSSGICRHRIAAILWLQGMSQDVSEPAAVPASPDFAGLRAVEPQKLARQLGARRLTELLEHRKAGEPVIRPGGSTITVELPWIPATVRLLEPLEHSSCSCHSQGLCMHKAQALLCWQLDQGLADPDALAALCPAQEGPDPETARQVCGEICRTLTAQLSTGLSRLPPETCETVERLAALAHTASLASLERALRALQEEYAACFARSAAFRDSGFLRRFSRAFQLAAAMEWADPPLLQALAGKFREDYLPAGRLELYLLGYRDVTGQSGYAGTIYYFWERGAKRFYTYSDLRPTFYEGSARRRTDAAPWGLPCTLRQAWKHALDLTNARANAEGGLSSTTQCTGALLGELSPDAVVPSQALCTDFSVLLDQYSLPGAPEVERLALVLPARCEPQPYDRVRQTFSLRLLDSEGRDLWVEVRYKKQEQPVVETLERLARRLAGHPEQRPVFFGSVYREGDRLLLYPIEVFTEWEVQP